MVKFSIKFNGVELTQWLDGVILVNRNLGQNRLATIEKVGRANGKKLRYTSAEETTIQITGLIMTDAVRKRHDLAGAMSTPGTARLIFGDEPTVYYDAIADQQSTLDEAYYDNRVLLNFIVPDGLAHSLDLSEATGPSGASIPLRSVGTFQSPPVLTATMNGDNGLVGWANDQGGVLQFGSSEELDGKQHDDSETVFHYDLKSAPTGVTLNAGHINYPYYLGDSSKPNRQAGSFSYTLNPDAATPQLTRSTSDHYWAGPSMSGTIHANSQGNSKGNCLWVNRFNATTNAPATGRIEFNLTSGSTVVLGMTVRDSNYSADGLELDAQFEGRPLFTMDLDRRQFTNGMFEAKIGKLGNQVTFTLSKVQKLTAAGVNASAVLTKVFNIDTLGATPIDGWTVWTPGFADKLGWTINWSDSIFQWVNVDFWQDLPNRFKLGDVVVADVAHQMVYVNGVAAPDLQAVGNQWDSFYIQPGDNSIMPLASSWAQAFDAQIEWREAYV
ncbi:MAG: phage tail family protein [Lactobacillus sp.]|nr:phage tail family protein [Lactobacillus sp.]MCI2032056.1 phage tail family protein [Lactobacillus sp.]